MVDSLNYLHKGEIKYECHHYGENHVLYHTAGMDEFMTLYEFFVAEPIQYNIIAERGSVLYHIPREEITREMKKSAELRQTIRMVEYDIHIRRNFHRIQHRCFYCQEEHHWYECVDNFATVNRKVLRS